MSALPCERASNKTDINCMQCAHKRLNVDDEGRNKDHNLLCTETDETREYDDESCTFAQTCEEVRAERHIGKGQN